MTQERWRIRLEDFKKSVERLGEVVARENTDDVIRDATIQRFEFTFELAWKTVKDYCESLGLDNVASPKTALQEAFIQKLFDDDQVWTGMLKDRNLMSHTYDISASEEIYLRIKNSYSQALRGLLEELMKK